MAVDFSDGALDGVIVQVIEGRIEQIGLNGGRRLPVLYRWFEKSRHSPVAATGWCVTRPAMHSSVRSSPVFDPGRDGRAWWAGRVLARRPVRVQGAGLQPLFHAPAG